MVTTEQKNKIESIWQAFYNGGMSVQTTIVDQLCVLMYLKMLDDKQSKMEASATAINEKLKESLKIFKKGDWENPETNIKIPYDDLRWSNFKNLNAVELPKRIRDYCFPFIKNLTKDNSDVFAKFLSDVSYGFDGKQEVLVKVVDMMSDIDFTDNDAMGDFFEHLIDGKINGQFRTPRHIIDMMVNMVQPVITDYIIDIKTMSLIQSHYRQNCKKVA